MTNVGPGTVVGRDRVIADLDHVLSEASAGRGRALVLRGEPGTGKTLLLGGLAERAGAAGVAVLAVAGVEFEADLGFGALHALLGPIGWEPPLVPPAGEAAHGAAVPPTSLLGCLAATHRSLVARARRQPILIVVDDAHWIDQESLRCLLFVARRVGEERVALVLASRPRSDSPPASSGLDELALGDLDETGAVALLRHRGLDRAVGRRCWRRVGGNPAALLEVARRLSDDQRRGDAPLPDSLPVAGHLVDYFADEVRQLPVATRRALIVAALATCGDVLLIARAVAHLGVDADALLVAEHLGVVDTGGGQLRWRHPLLPAAVLSTASSEETRDAHAALVGGDFGSLDDDRVMWHLAQSTIAPDEAVAARLEACGARARDRGALLSAANAFARAARFTPDRQAGARRLLLAGRAWQAAGEWRSALEALEPVIDLVEDPVLSADLGLVLGAAELWERGPVAAMRRFESRAAAVRDVDPRRCAQLLFSAAGPALSSLDPDAALRAAERVCDLGAESGDFLLASSAVACAELVGLFAGRDVEPERVARIADLARASVAGCLPLSADLALLCACAQLAIGQWEPALDTVEDLAVSPAPDNAVYLTRTRRLLRADILWRLGRWDRSLAEVELAAAVDGGTHAAVESLAAMAQVEAGLGRHEACTAHAGAALEIAGPRDLHSTEAAARRALGWLASAEGRHDRAAAEFERVAWLTRRVRQPGWMWWQGDAIDAFHAAGDHARARAVLDRLTDDARRVPGRWADATVARGRALLGLADAEAELARALTLFHRLPAPFETGRTLLQRGRHRIAAGGDGGPDDLRAAGEVFEALGAPSWRALVDDALRPVDPSPPAAVARLTPAERRVARAVAEGNTNTQAAARLFVSVKTVDFHLQSIYRKLGIQRRTQLAWLLAGPSEGGDQGLAAAGGPAGGGSRVVPIP